MRQKINNVDIIDIDEWCAKGIISELNQLSSGGIMLYLDKYPNLVMLYKYLNASFNSSIHGVHHISCREEIKL